MGANGLISRMICDCDGVLIDSEAVALQMLARELEGRWPGIDVLPVLTPLLGLRIEQVLAQAALACARSLSDAEVALIRLHVEQASMQAPAVAGVAAALAQIGLPKACASNSHTAYVQAVLARTGLQPFFEDRLWCADRVARPKPAPDVYLAAAAGFGVPCAACLVVEDSTTGVSAALAAGMTVIGFAGGGHAGTSHAEVLRRAGARCTIDAMAALPAAVAALVAASGCTDQQGSLIRG